mgnify:CR=1 FL=1
MGDLEMIIGIIKDRSINSGFSERDEVLEVIENLKKYYKLWKY